MTHFWRISVAPAAGVWHGVLSDKPMKPDDPNDASHECGSARSSGGRQFESLEAMIRRTGVNTDLAFSGPAVFVSDEARAFLLLLLSAGTQSLRWDMENDNLRLVWQTRGQPVVPAELRELATTLGASLGFESATQGTALIPADHVERPAPRVLVVEDSPLIAFDLADVLGREGAGEVNLAMSLEEARLALAGGQFDIVLLDVSLGRDCSDVLLPAARGAWVVIVSGHLVESLPPAFSGLTFLSKPLQPEDVRNLLRRWVDAASKPDSSRAM